MSCRFIVSFLAATFALIAAANAVEFKRHIEIKGEQGAAWAKIGGWCAIADWHPVIAKCEESDVGGKKHRRLTTKDGAVIEETMVKSDKYSYTYKIDESPLPVTNYTSTFAVTPDDDNKDEINVVWSTKFDPKGASEADAKKTMAGIFKAGLDEIKKKLK